FLVDVPVRVRVWTRPEMQKKQFEIIRKAKPRILFLVSDGPREKYVEDYQRILHSRAIVENIDWECCVYKIYYENNLGMYNSAKLSLEIIWREVDRCIFLEDDYLPSVSYF